MAEPFIGQITTYGFNFAPKNFAFCNGELLPINNNQSLFALLGITFGGDGRTTVGLPDLRGRAPVHYGNGLSQGMFGGTETNTLNINQMPQHTHQFYGNSADANVIFNHEDRIEMLATVPATGGDIDIYGDPSSLTSLQSGTVSSTGSGLSYNIMQPYTAINFCIALLGLFPSRN